MAEHNLTASMVVSFSERLEDESASYYAALAERFPEHSTVFSEAAHECAKHKVWIIRTYRETISDALEACFCFQGLDLRHYGGAEASRDPTELQPAIRTAIAWEKRAIAFYRDAAQRSDALLATIPGAFRRVAKKRSARKGRWEELLAEMEQTSL